MPHTLAPVSPRQSIAASEIPAGTPHTSVRRARPASAGASAPRPGCGTDPEFCATEDPARSGDTTCGAADRTRCGVAAERRYRGVRGLSRNDRRESANSGSEGRWIVLWPRRVLIRGDSQRQLQPRISRKRRGSINCKCNCIHWPRTNADSPDNCNCNFIYWPRINADNCICISRVEPRRPPRPRRPRKRQ